VNLRATFGAGLAGVMARARACGTELLAVLTAHPRHAVLATLVAGLAVRGAGRTPALVALASAALIIVAGGRRPAVVAGIALLLGSAGAELRLASLDHTELTSWLDRGVAVVAVTTEPSRAAGRTGRSRVVAEIRGGLLPRERIGVLLPVGVHVRAGRELALRGRLVALDERDGFLQRRGAHALLLARQARRTGRRRGGLPGAVDGVRDRVDGVLARGLSPSRAALARGMALGDDSALSPSLREAFRTSGLSHLLAASGQNVALLCALALALGAALGLPRRGRLALALVLTGLYVPLAGGGPSILRAGAMGGATLVAGLAGRPASRVYALLVAAAVTLGADPRATSDPGWQLSFAAVLAIAVLARPWAQRLRDRGVPPSIAEAAALTAAATVGTAPLIMFHFGRLSLVSLPANVLAAPAVVPVVWIATLAGVAGQVSAAAGGALAGLAAVPLAYLDALARAAARVPSAELPLRIVSPLALVAIYVVLAALAVTRRLRVPAMVVGVPLLAAVMATARPPPPPDPNTLIVSFLDVGQGDATLIQHRGVSVLVDTGPPVAPVLERLRDEGVRRLDLLVVTHAEADHDGNAVKILPVGLILDGGSYSPSRPSHIALRAAAAAHGVRLLPPALGQVLRLGPLELDVLWPDPALAPGALKAGANRNDHAVVLHVRDGTFDLLLPSDAESNVTSRLGLPRVEAFKVSHHGSRDPGLAGILTRLRSQVAVIEVGDPNPYGHPTRQALKDLKASGALLRRTDQDGTVRLLVRPSGMQLATTK